MRQQWSTLSVHARYASTPTGQAQARATPAPMGSTMRLRPDSVSIVIAHVKRARGPTNARPARPA